MARDAKVEVSVVNLRIQSKHARDYSRLLASLAATRQGVAVYGDSYLTISHFNTETGWGVFSKYTELDTDGIWFDLDSFDSAKPERVSEIVIPKALKPNLSQFYFQLDTKLHIITFEIYSDSKNLSPRAVDRYFKSALAWPAIAGEFGRVESDLVKDHSAVERLLALPDLRELDIVIRPMNTDDLGDDLASVIEERLAEQGADEYQEILKSKSGSLDPNDRTKKLASIAAENGRVTARSLVDGVITTSDTANTPLRDLMVYKSDEPSSPVFSELAKRVSKRIDEQRKQVRGE